MPGISTFTAYFQNGYHLYKGGEGEVCHLDTGISGWQCSSDRNLKTKITLTQGRAVLNALARLPISRWSFTGSESIRTVGPMSQDFSAAFGMGTDDKSISALNMSCVALAAIQGLNQKLDHKTARSKAKEAKLAAQAHQLAALQRELAAIKKRLSL